MATSGSVDYNRTAKQLIKSALRGIGVIQSGEEPSHDEMQDSLETLEMMVKSLQGMGYHLWTYAEATLFLSEGKDSYSLAGDRAVSTFVETETTADASSTDTTIPVDSIAGISDGDVIGIVTSGTTIFWTTVNGPPSGSTITLTDALTTDVSSGAVVYAYGSDDLINRPLRIETVRRRNGANDTPLEELGREDYFILPNKTTKGTPTNFYYDPGRAVGTLYVWPTASTVDDTLKFTYIRPIEDFDATSNNPDLPQEWLETLKYQLMVRLSHEYGVQLDQTVVLMASGLLDEMMGWDTEPASVTFQPDMRY